MLVLTRRPGESIIIGDGIKLTVVNLGPGRVKIGIEAPPNVRIDREEIHSRILQERHECVCEEHASDVLMGMSADVVANQSSQNTTVNASSETGILHNRIADKLPAELPLPAPAANQSSNPAPKVPKFRAPRKPR